MADQKSQGKAPKNIVHEQAILVETIKKELREGKLYDNFSINPFEKRMNIFSLPLVYNNFLYNQRFSHSR